jgi:TorA maturation chaperone TorD
MTRNTDHDTALASLYSLLSECFKHPNEAFHEDVASGRFDAERDRLLTALERDHSIETPTSELVPATRAAFDNEYISLFEAFESPYAPPIESPYKEWHAGADAAGLLGGPPADDMRQRYAAVGAEPPEEYQPDHLALLLEYASVLVESGDSEAYATFLAGHFDWVPAFRLMVDDATADAPFHRRMVRLTDDVLAVERTRLDVPEPERATIETMIDRVAEGMEGLPEEKHFRE